MSKCFTWQHNTQAFGTPIIDFAPPVANRKARLSSLVYTAAGTVHDLVLMRCINQVVLTDAAPISDTTLDLSAATFADQTLASGDYVILEHADGTYGMYLASGLATLVLTVNAIAKAANAGAKVYIMGSAADTAYHTILKSIASTRIEFQATNGVMEGGYYASSTYNRTGLGDPIAFLSANGTAAGILNWGSGLYVTN